MIVTPNLQITKWRLKEMKRLAQVSGSDRMRTQNCLMGVSLRVAALLTAAWSMFQKGKCGLSYTQATPRQLPPALSHHTP